MRMRVGCLKHEGIMNIACSLASDLLYCKLTINEKLFNDFVLLIMITVLRNNDILIVITIPNNDT